ncbi:MAG: TIGR03560 family F420-dependent LLM class oxidoreductase [Acidimicrobiia bacterium]|nr:TIGR03560 family F420-dependent LLM class oxidoreductase [Acidimicrobiia bacterium]
MRFGTMVPQGWKLDLTGLAVEDQWPRILDTARTIEDIGYDSLWVYDHFHTHPIVAQESVFEAWSLMAALAAVTTRVRIGQMCTCALYRPPSLLAKQALSVDAIAGGRLDVGIGAGWSDKEFRAYGYDYPRDGVRLDMLEEAVQVLIEMWTKDEAYFEGEHYGLDGAITRPRSVQQPYPPLWIAGGGRKRTLKIVAKYGDFSNFSDNVEEFIELSEILAGHCEDVGRDYKEIGRTAHLMSVVGRNEAEVNERLEVAAERRGGTPEEFREEHLVGTVDQVTEVLGQYAEAGCVEMILYFYDMGAHDSLELVAGEVIPQLR